MLLASKGKFFICPFGIRIHLVVVSINALNWFDFLLFRKDFSDFKETSFGIVLGFKRRNKG